ncbi:hypothetical protein AA0111_g4546 [Alternaria arborescens]|nr:hypothetical protein AA0111_g4546 [Alternaria arborescens]RYO32770.1 hypothetical protein AA0111_g4546 [Alternaria arborescens]
MRFAILFTNWVDLLLSFKEVGMKAAKYVHCFDENLFTSQNSDG